MLGKDWGGIAQLGERLNGIQEVNGSIPFISNLFSPNFQAACVYQILRGCYDMERIV